MLLMLLPIPVSVKTTSVRAFALQSSSRNCSLAPDLVFLKLICSHASSLAECSFRRRRHASREAVENPPPSATQALERRLEQLGGGGRKTPKGSRGRGAEGRSPPTMSTSDLAAHTQAIPRVKERNVGNHSVCTGS